MVKSSWFQRYLLPGFVFQSVVIAGGYGTGREIAEFFLSRGPRGGLLAMVLVSTVVWSAVSAITFELARMTGSYDYRRFFRHLLGPAWALYEIGYLILLLIILAVIAAAAGSVLRDTVGLPYWTGVAGMLAAVGVLTFRGSRVIERVFMVWSGLLYTVYAAVLGWAVVRFGPTIVENFREIPAGDGWIRSGVAYAAYNLALVPAVLFCARHQRTRREALTAGLLTGPIAMLPALAFFVAMVGHYPAAVDAPVPATLILGALGVPFLTFAFQVVLFGTLIETGTGLLHAVNERLAAHARERGTRLPSAARPAVAIAALIAGALLARVGLIALIARGYGTLTWWFMLVFVLPTLTIGLLKVVRTPSDTPPSTHRP